MGQQFKTILICLCLAACTDQIVKNTARPTNEEGEIPGYLQQTEVTIEPDSKFVSIGNSKVEIPGNNAISAASPRVRLGRLSAEGIAKLNADAQLEINQAVSEDIVSISYVDGNENLIGSDALSGDYEFRTRLKDGTDTADLKALIVTDPGQDSEANFLSDVDFESEEGGAPLALINSAAFAKLRLSATQLIITVVRPSADLTSSNIKISNRVRSGAGSDPEGTSTTGSDAGATSGDAGDSNPNNDPGLELQNQNTWMATSVIPNESVFINANYYNMVSGTHYSLVTALNSTATANVWAILDHATHQWTELAASQSLEARKQAGIAIVGSKALVWSGYRDNFNTPFADGGVIDLAKKEWESESLPALDAPPKGVDPVLNCVLADGRVVMWGFSSTITIDRNQGSVWNFDSNQWTKIPSSGAPSNSLAIGSATCDAVNQKAYVLTSSSNPQLYVLDLSNTPTWAAPVATTGIGSELNGVWPKPSALFGGKIYVPSTHLSGSGEPIEVYILNLTSGDWSKVERSVAGSGFQSVRAVQVGGAFYMPYGTSNPSWLLKFDFSSASWSSITPSAGNPTDRGSPILTSTQGTTNQGGRALMFGGSASSNSQFKPWIYRPAD
jgi:hypothetical protein